MDSNPTLGGGGPPAQHLPLPDDLDDLWDEALRNEDQLADDDAEDPFGLGGSMDNDDGAPPAPPAPGSSRPRATSAALAPSDDEDPLGLGGSMDNHDSSVTSTPFNVCPPCAASTAEAVAGARAAAPCHVAPFTTPPSLTDHNREPG